jgi:hypothetical protein
MPRGGPRPNSGRPKGSKSRAPKERGQQQEMRAAINADGELSLAAQLRIMRYWMGVFDNEREKGEAADNQVIKDALARASEAANRAQPYQHARLSSVRVGGDADNPLRTAQEWDLSKLTDEQLETLGHILEALGPPERPGDMAPGNGERTH